MSRRASRVQLLRLALLAAVTVLLSSTPAAGSFDPKTWKARKPIALAGSNSRYAEAALDADTYHRAARSLVDLRVVTAQEQEIPYVIRSWPASETMETVSLPLFNLSVQARRTTRFELRTVRPGERHNQVLVTVLDEEFLPRQVTVEGSDDRRTWFVLAKREIYHFPMNAVDTVGYTQSIYRFVRVTIYDDGRPALRVATAALRIRATVPAREDRWFAGPVRTVEDIQTRTTTFVADAGFQRLPLSRLMVSIAEPAAYVRPAHVEVSDDGTTWVPATETTLVRTTQTLRGEPVSIPFGEVRGRYVRLTVRNADNPPLQITRVAVYGIQRTVLFPVASGQRYWLYLDGPADPPHYDLPEVLSRETAAPRPVLGVLGHLEPSPAYVPPPPPRRPWTEENPFAFWAILGGVGIALALLIISTALAARGAR